MLDALQRQFGLLPERLDQPSPSLHRLQAPAREITDLGDRRRTQIGDLMLLQIGPDRLDRIEFWRIGRQRSDGDVTVLLFEPVTHEPTAVGGHAVPDDQRSRGQVLPGSPRGAGSGLAFCRPATRSRPVAFGLLPVWEGRRGLVYCQNRTQAGVCFSPSRARAMSERYLL